MPSRRTRKQRGGGVDVVRAQEESIRQKEDELKSGNWEKYHFFLQLIRIPFKNQTFDLIRLCLNASYRSFADISVICFRLIKDWQTAKVKKIIKR